MLRGIVVAAWAIAANAQAAEKEAEAPQGVHTVRADESLVVYGDLFARWADTRWFIETEVRLPTWMTWATNNNYEMRVSAFQVRAVLACEKDWKLTRRRIEVFCHIEDVGLQVVTLEGGKYRHAQRILDEMHGKLKGAAVQLQVLDNGRVVNVDLENVPPRRNRRENQIHEALRTIMARLVLGFDMKLRKSNYLSTGQWVELRTGLLAMPSSTLTPASGLIVHQLNGYNGHIVVQTKGEGQIQDDNEAMYAVQLNGVSIYDEDEGFMTERVWSLVGTRTADSFMSFGTMMADYSHAGRLRLLGPTQKVDVGPTREVTYPGAKGKEHLPLWAPIESGY
jgi:hypothetical protein